MEVFNEEADHAVAVPVPPIMIHHLEGQIDPNINTDTVNISSSICFYLFFFFRLPTQITWKIRKYTLFDCVQKSYL